jgi:lipoprotein signal peptidase
VNPGSPSLQRLLRIAGLVAVADLSTKWIASKLWSDSPAHLTDWISMAVFHNDAGAFGLSAGAYTWQLNLALTLAAVIFIIPVTRDLTHIDRRAPTALGLIVGGALGNLASLLVPPRGVMDFISLNWSPGHSLVLNVADVAAYTGLAMILRTGVIIAATLRREAALVAESRLGSAFAVKRMVKQAMHHAPAPAAQRRIHEELVNDWSLIPEVSVIRADAAVVEETDVLRPLSVEVRQRVDLNAPTRPMSRAEHLADL